MKSLSCLFCYQLCVYKCICPAGELGQAQHWDCKLRDFPNLAADRFVALAGWNVLKWTDHGQAAYHYHSNGVEPSEIVLYRDISQ